MQDFLRRFIFVVENRVHDLKALYEKTGDLGIKTMIALNQNVLRQLKDLLDEKSFEK